MCVSQTRYWPDSEFDDSYPLVISGAYVDDALSISLVSEERISIPGVILRTLRLYSSLNRGSRVVMQYQYLNWPQQGTVISHPPTVLLQFYLFPNYRDTLLCRRCGCTDITFGKGSK